MKRLLVLSACAVFAAAGPSLAVAQPFPLTGKPPGAPQLTPTNSQGFPPPRTVPGEPIETRPPELSTDKPSIPGQTRASYRATGKVIATVMTDKLEKPWSIAPLPDGKLLVTEKPGRMRVIERDGTVSASIVGVPQVNYQDTVGLLDVALDRNFALNHLIFFSYSEPVGGDESTIVIARARLDEASLSLADLKVIFRCKPTLPKALAELQGGRLAVARDGTIFATIGDRSKSPPWAAAQRLDTDLGKIIHIMPDGAPAPHNPFAGKAGALAEIWSLGHRNPIGLAFDRSGQLWENENGPRGGDELNRIRPGRNYGWPLVVHGIDYPGELINGGLTRKAGLEEPIYYWDPVIAPSGMAFYDADLFPLWKGSVLIGALRGQMLVRLGLRNGKVVEEEPLLVDLHARIRDVRVGVDGAVYVATDDARILKLTPAQ